MTFLKNIAKAVLPFAVLSGLLLFLSARELLNPYWVQIFQLACVVAISALGLNLIYGFTGLFSLGHAAFYGVGAYTAALLTKLYVGAYGDEALLRDRSGVPRFPPGGRVRRGAPRVSRRPAHPPVDVGLPRHRHARVRGHHEGPLRQRGLPSCRSWEAPAG